MESPVSLHEASEHMDTLPARFPNFLVKLWSGHGPPPTLQTPPLDQETQRPELFVVF